jgi:ribosome-associated heat shock protein Hsp15
LDSDTQLSTNKVICLTKAENGKKDHENDMKSRRQNQTSPDPGQIEVRLDKWLQVARIFKTRSQSGEAIDAGHVKMEGSRAKAGRILKIGDAIEVQKGNRKLFLTVKGLAAKPIAKDLARELYSVKEEADCMNNLSEDDREQMRMMQQMDRINQASRKGRPSRREREDINKAKGRH